MPDTIEEKICFIISPIGDEESETRKFSDKVLKHIITPPVEQLGYKVIRADKISEPGIITTQIIQHIVDSELVIADLTDRNPNVFYELAIRHAIRKPLIQVIKKGEIIPFDVAATRIIQFDIQDLDSVDAAKKEIITQGTSLESGKNDIDNPISVSLDLKMLKESGNPEQRSLADIMEALSDLRTTISSGEKSHMSSKSLDDLRLLMETLPRRIENRIYPESRKRRKLFPMMFEDYMSAGIIRENPYLHFLMVISLFKDDFPWIYEIGIETYRELRSKKSKLEKKKSVESFNMALEILSQPIMRDFFGKSEELYVYGKELRHYLHRYLMRFIEENIE